MLLRAPVNGARRWLSFGIVKSIQPSEFAKIGLVIALAALLTRREGEVTHPTRTLLPILGLVSLFAGLVLLEPDFGTALTYFVIAGAMLFFAGLPLKYFLGSALLLVPTLSAFVWTAQYRRDRLMAFLHPEADPLGRGFHAIQSLIAVGTGGVTGLGLGHGKQKLFFLPYPYTDFIYAIVGEELGLIGCAAVLALFGFLFARGVRAAANAPDSFGRLLGIGFSVMIVVQALVNISVVLVAPAHQGDPAAVPLVRRVGALRRPPRGRDPPQPLAARVMTERGFLIAGGGTGGHVFPALALAGEIRRRRPGAPVVFVGTARGLETTLVPKAGFPLELVRAKGLVGKGWRARLEGFLALPLAFVDSLRLLAPARPARRRGRRRAMPRARSSPRRGRAACRR